MRKRVTPLGALVRGLAAGAAGAALQTLFLKLTAPIAPKSLPGAFEPVEPEQKGENALETVARRFVDCMMQRGPIDETRKKELAVLVHYGFGARWGALYGLARETVPALSSAAGVIGWSTLVWMTSDNLVLPVFRVAGWPNAYPPSTHAYAWAAHLVYGAGLWSAYEALRPRSVALALGNLWATYQGLRLGRHLPRIARPALRGLLRGAARAAASDRLAAAGEVLAG